ncbi:MAG: CotH kinase family protein [Verrucomicrobiales bacterium]|nr:CotH kinase family protein [Verrucomicrobiales bacterium]
MTLWTRAQRLCPPPLRGWFSLVLLSTLPTYSGLCQQGPQIDAATMRTGADGSLRFQFRSDASFSGRFAIEFAAELTQGGSWLESSTAEVSPLAQGSFQVTDRAPLQPRFYRVRAFPGDAPSAPLWINEVMSDNVSKLADGQGAYYDWIEVYNPNDEAVQLAGYGLSDDESLPGKWRFPSHLIQPQGFTLVYASDLNVSVQDQPLHANFKLRASGESLFLSDPANRLVDRLDLPVLAPDQSYGRMPDGADNLALFSKANASPGTANSTVSLPPALPSPRFLPEGGLYPATISVEVQPAEAGQVLHYTLNGSIPTLQSAVLAQPISLTRSTVLRVLAVDALGRKSAPASRSYLIGVAHSLPIVSLATSPTNLDFKNGFLYGMGPSVLGSQNQVLQNYPYSGSHAWKDREVEVALEFFEPGGQVALRQQAGMKVYGGWGSRGYPQKSLALFARRAYGSGKFKHQIFPDQSLDEFESFVLRNSGNDNQSSHQTPLRPPITQFGPTTSYGSYFANGTFTLLRDAFMQQLLDGTTLDTQGYRPSVVYINGDYWGIYNLREKITEHHVISHHDLAPGKVDLIEGYGSVRAGSGTVYNQLRQFLASKNLATGTNYAFVADTYLDIDNFIDYHLAVIYFQNFDIGNIKCWRPRVTGGKFRWLVYDQDYGFGLWPASVYEPAMARDYADYSNMFRFYTAGSGTSDGWPNAGGRTLMLRTLLTNPGFKERFIRRCADLLNSNFREDRVVQTLESMAAVIRPEMGAHLQRWSWTELVKRGFGKPHQQEYSAFTPETWETHLQVVAEFGRNRPARLRQDCQSHFRLNGGLGTLEIKTEPPASGSVQLNSLRLEGLPWSGVYFADYPSTLLPIPAPGFQFAGWMTPNGLVTSRRITQGVTRDVTTSVTAQMIPAATPSATPSDLIISEIQYHPGADAESGDWIELYNRGSAPVDLGGWIFRDDEDAHAFPLPERTLAAGEFLVLCEDDFKFRMFQPANVPCVGNFRFGLGNDADALRLYRPDGSVAASVNYQDEAPWPSEADGTGFTLQLRSLSADPSLPGSWKPSAQAGGTPGRE